MRHGKTLPLNSTLLSLFISSLTLFVFEIVITRVFSPMFRYHFVFLISSTAVFGLGLGGFVAYKLLEMFTIDIRRILSRLQFLQGLSYIISFFLIYKLPFLHNYLFYSLIAGIPFVAGGCFIAIIFLSLSKASHKLYFADLLGAGAGSIVTIVLLNNAGITGSVMLISLMVFGIAGYYSFKLKDYKITVISSLVFLVLLGMSLNREAVKDFEEQFTGYYTSPLTSLATFKEGGFNFEVVDFVWDAYSRTDLLRVGNAENTINFLTIDGGANSQMVQVPISKDDLQMLYNDLNYIPFLLGENKNVLLIGSGGGKDVQLALLAGSENIHAVEINKGSIELVRKHTNNFQNIYDQPGVQTFIQDGRNFVKQSTLDYDLIYMAQVMSGAAEIGGYALSENYIYTKEALADYWQSINDNGRIAFVMHDGRDLTRIILTIQEVLSEMGFTQKEIENRLIVANRTENGGSSGEAHMPLVVLSKALYQDRELTIVRDSLLLSHNQPLYLPTGQYADFWVQIETLKNLSGFKPVYDDSPYFYSFSNGIELNLLIILLLSVLIALVFYFPAKQKHNLTISPLYFAILGMSFMLIEIPLIEIFNLYLGHPTRSFVVTLSALLLSGGIGSLVGSNKKILLIRNKYVPLLITAMLSLGVFEVSKYLQTEMIVKSLGMRYGVVFLLLFPLGFFMGMPFPFGIKILGEAKKEKTIPLIWGINGTTSITGSVLSVVVSMQFGFSYSLILGAILYLLLFFPMPIFKDMQ